MKSLTIFRLTSSLLLLGVALASPGISQNASCYSPGTLVVDDSPDISILPYLDTEKVFIAEPHYADGSQKLVITMKVKTLRPDLAVVTVPLGVWTVVLTNSNGSDRYVQMNTLLGSPRFTHGTVSNLLGIPIFNEIGQIQGEYNTTGTITFVVNKSSIGNPPVGSQLTVEARTYLNTVGIGLVQIDLAGSAVHQLSGNSGCNPFQFVNWGMNGDTPVANDYTRNGTSDQAVWRPSNGIWYTFDPLNSQENYIDMGSGQDGDTPVTGDFDNDNLGDHAVYRRSTGTWQIRRTETGQTTFFRFGLPEDMPLSGDFDGDHVDEIAVFRPSTGVWYTYNFVTGGVTISQFGISEDRPLVGDFDGDRRDDIAVFRPSTGVWYMTKSSNGSVGIVGFGLGTDRAVPADYDGDDKTDVAIFRPETGDWWVIKSDSGQLMVYNWGSSPDVVHPADYNGNGRADFAVWRPSTGVWYIKHN
jgi:FG-GAP repeat.